MKSLFSSKTNPELQARKAIRSKKWTKALSYYEKEIKSNDRDYFLWNILGDLQFNTKAKAQALESWRRALEGFSSEGLHENVLGISRKILRRIPEEDDIYLLISEAYLGLEYYSDCLISLRSYLKIAKHKSASEMKTLFKKILDAKIKHAHLLEELQHLYKQSEIDDYELDKEIQEYIATISTVKFNSEEYVGKNKTDDMFDENSVENELYVNHTEEADGLMVLDSSGHLSFGETLNQHYADARVHQPVEVLNSDTFDSDYVTNNDSIVGDEKDHYDLGIVYRDMKLWDAAISEFEMARRDPALRTRATIAYVECLQETHDIQSALKLLDQESKNEKCSSQELLTINFHKGMLYEDLGNLAEALDCYEQVVAENASYGDAESRITTIREKLNQN